VIRPVTEPSHAVFLSYASQDAAGAQRICEALRAAGIEVWFDQSELRGGDAWDQSIRKQIKTCALFLPIISHTTHDRREGYFRLEWKLAVDRCHLMDADMAFLLPVVIDDTRDDDERVPERFREVQWTRLPGGATPAAFVERVRRLLSRELSQGPTGTESAAARVSAAPTTRKPVLASWRSKAALLVTIAVVVVALAYLVANRLVLSKRFAEVGAAPGPAAQSAPAPVAVFNPPPHSIAVLPFVNMSGDKDQEYFSDGLTEELLNSLVRINELQVAARTSSFSFKGKDADIATIARKLNVGAVLEGSVRTGGHKIRVTAELTNAVTGFHLWSQTYDRQLSDVLQLQTDIANAVTSALKLALLGNITQKIEMGGTHNPSAFDAYLHATKAYRGDLDERSMQEAVAGYSEAIHLDPAFAMAYAGRSLVLNGLGRNYAAGAKLRDYDEKAQADARKAVTLVPDLAVGHLALANVLESTLDFPGANSEYARALALAPGDAKVLQRYGQFEVLMGHTDVGLDALRRSVTLDPLNGSNYFLLGEALVWARRPTEALVSFKEAKALEPDDASVYGWLGYAYLTAHDFHNAKEACERTIEGNRFHCLAMAYEGLGRHADAEAMLAKLTSMKGGTPGVFIAMIYAQRGDMDRALDWLDKSVRERDSYLEYAKTNPFLDPLRKEPRFQAIERALKFPN
jgi:TolB-like protein/tetratricopeptide (TPR) repeat protein